MEERVGREVSRENYNVSEMKYGYSHVVDRQDSKSNQYESDTQLCYRDMERKRPSYKQSTPRLPKTVPFAEKFSEEKTNPLHQIFINTISDFFRD